MLKHLHRLYNKFYKCLKNSLENISRLLNTITCIKEPGDFFSFTVRRISNLLLYLSVYPLQLRWM